MTPVVASAVEIERYGEPVFMVCDTFAYHTERYGIDLDLQAYDALIALIEGKPLEVALGYITDGHPGAAAGRQALAELPNTPPPKTAASSRVPPRVGQFSYYLGDAARGGDGRHEYLWTVQRAGNSTVSRHKNGAAPARHGPCLLPSGCQTYRHQP